jgi:hypothetical protein
MIITPPFYLRGTAGATLGAEAYLLSNLGAMQATLTLRSLEADTLFFFIQDNGSRPAIPDDGQWITLVDDAGTVLFTGIAKRSYRYPEKVYSFECSNVYKGLSDTLLIGSDGRPYLLRNAEDLATRLQDILLHAQAAGLPIQPPNVADMPSLYLGPKQAFRSASYAAALEDTLKWCPDVVTRMDYSTTPPTLRFVARRDASPITLDMDSDANQSTAIQLASYPEARALGIEICYQRRDSSDVISLLKQSAGDMTAEASRRLSVFLSGQERADMLASEALTSAKTALTKCNQIITATGAAVAAVPEDALIPLSFSGLKGLDSNLSAAETAQAGFTMAAASGNSFQLYTSISWSGSPWTYKSTLYTVALALRTATGSLATGWYPIRSGSISDADLTTAGATKQTLYITGDLTATRGYYDSDAGMASLIAAGAAAQVGWTSNVATSSTDANNYYQKNIKYPVNITVDAINKSPSEVFSLVNAAAGKSALITRADFVEAPEGLALNYFTRQDWTPYKGSITLSSGATSIPAPGDFINILGTGTPSEWASMTVPVASLDLDLSTGIARLTIGPSPRQDYQNLSDRLRIPQEDNYQPG